MTVKSARILSDNQMSASKNQYTGFARRINDQSNAQNALFLPGENRAFFERNLSSVQRPLAAKH